MLDAGVDQWDCEVVTLSFGKCRGTSTARGRSSLSPDVAQLPSIQQTLTNPCKLEIGAWVQSSAVKWESNRWPTLVPSIELEKKTIPPC